MREILTTIAFLGIAAGATPLLVTSAAAQRTPPPDEECFNEKRVGSLGIKMCESGSGIHSRGYVVVFRTDKSVTNFCMSKKSKRSREFSHCDRFIANDMEVLYADASMRRDRNGVGSLTVRTN